MASTGSQPPRSFYDTPLSEVFPRLTIEGRLALTPSSLVLRAQQHSPQRRVAIKVLSKGLSADAIAVARFRRETETAAGLHHPNLVEIYATDSYAGVPYLVMEYLDGGDLGQAIAEGRLELNEILRIAVGLARALSHVHSCGLVHRDVKPANVLLGSSGAVKLTDLGMVKHRGGTHLTTRDTCMGTPEYMAPEQVEDFAHVTPAADVYSFGATLYHAVYGEAPFADVSVVRQLKRTLRSRPNFPPRPDLPQNLVRLLACCLEKDPRRRFRDGSELLANVKRVRVQRAPRLPGLLRLPLWRTALAMCVVALGVGAAWLLSRC